MSPSDSTVLYRDLSIPLRFSSEDQSALAQFAAVLSQQVAGSRPFSCLLTSDRALRKLNREFLGHDYPTDVLSFPAAQPDLPAGEIHPPLGDLAISVERAQSQALAFGHSRLDEVRILMVHGLLHLLGFDHETDRGRMARAERKWRLHFGLPPNLIARTREGVAS